MPGPKHPILYFGTGPFGSSHVPALQDEASVSELLDVVRGLGISQIDTAGRYPPDNPGASERMLGATKAAGKGFTIHTKVLLAGTSTAGSLSREAVRASVAGSREHLGVDKIGILYAHAPDEATPLEEQAEAFNEQYQTGFCEKIGVSNFPVDMVERLVAICEARGYVQPSVYQGQYNLVCRAPEEALLPALRKHGMAFNAYSPLAAGFLTGKLTAGQAEGTRLGGTLGAAFRGVYDQAPFHDAVRSLHRVLEPLGLGPTGAALRWLAYHSALGEGDGIILGASKAEQIRQNVADINEGPLPAEVVAAIEDIWAALGEGDRHSGMPLAAVPKR